MSEEKEREFLKHKSWTDYLPALVPVFILICIAGGCFYFALMTPLSTSSATGEIIGFRMHSGMISPWYTAIVRVDDVTEIHIWHEFENPVEVSVGICGIEEFKYFRCGIGSRVTVTFTETILVQEHWEISELLG